MSATAVLAFELVHAFERAAATVVRFAHDDLPLRIAEPDARGPLTHDLTSDRVLAASGAIELMRDLVGLQTHRLKFDDELVLRHGQGPQPLTKLFNRGRKEECGRKFIRAKYDEPLSCKRVNCCHEEIHAHRSAPRPLLWAMRSRPVRVYTAVLSRRPAPRRLRPSPDWFGPRTDRAA